MISEHFTGPTSKLKELAQKCDSEIFDKSVFDEIGVFVIRKVFTQDFIKQYRRNFYKLHVKDSPRDKFNHVSAECTDNELRQLAKNQALLKEVSKVFGSNLALFNFRFVIKDKNNFGEVFMHNDICYHCGSMDRLSAFVPITPVNPLNGGMEYFLGTHNFGYMGDAGELNIDCLGKDWPSISPSISPGDLVLMHSALWHRSQKNESKEDRIIADIHFQPANDPSGSELACGMWQTEYRFPHRRSQDFFLRSRVSRMIELEREVKELKQEIKRLSL